MVLLIAALRRDASSHTLGEVIDTFSGLRNHRLLPSNDSFWISIGKNALLLFSVPILVGLVTFQGKFRVNQPALLAGVALSMIPMIVIHINGQRCFARGLTAGASKG